MIITQTDRKAMAAYYRHPLVDNPSMAESVLSENWEAGASDSERALLETFTAHREAEREAMVSWLRSNVKECERQADRRAQRDPVARADDRRNTAAEIDVVTEDRGR